MKIIALGASTSQQSINKVLATYAAHLVEGGLVEVLDLNDFELPLYSEDREKTMGQPAAATQFIDKLKEADAIIVSLAEHNGTYTAAFKNLLDWASRVSREVYQHKPVVFLATSPGPGGAASVLDVAVQSAPFFSANVKGSLSIPSFYDHFDASTQRLTNSHIHSQLEAVVHTLTR